MNVTLPFPAVNVAAQNLDHIDRSTGTHGPAPLQEISPAAPPGDYQPLQTLAFYRKHTHALLRRYLYASMLVGRTPAMLIEPLMRGWSSHRRTETFEDCIIFVLDVEKCLARLSALDHVLITRIAIQEYSYAETALLLNRSERFIALRFGEATDRLTEILLESGTLTIPHRRPHADDHGHDG